MVLVVSPTPTETVSVPERPRSCFERPAERRFVDREVEGQRHILSPCHPPTP